MIKLFNETIEKKIDFKVFSLTKKYTKELLILYFSFYNWREIAKIKVKTEEILKRIRNYVNNSIWEVEFQKIMRMIILIK